VPTLTTDAVGALQEQVRALAAERNAVILAHNYQLPEVQDVADLVGDSLGLSQAAAHTESDVIAFCGVHFMAETAAILSPDKTVLIPDLDAGCSLSDSITADQLRAWKAQHPGAIVVMYVNTSAEVKAETDYCCTSSNAVKVVEHIFREHGGKPEWRNTLSFLFGAANEKLLPDAAAEVGCGKSGRRFVLSAFSARPIAAFCARAAAMSAALGTRTRPGEKTNSRWPS